MSSTGKIITFQHRMGKSWAVDLQPDIAFSNSRGAHVETHQEALEGKQFRLGARSTRTTKDGIAVMYEVVGVLNGRFPAHLTTYFGDPAGASAY